MKNHIKMDDLGGFPPILGLAPMFEGGGKIAVSSGFEARTPKKMM